jgi:spore coat polysaccharide biosynthesis predicted glycosyltransferase SpsG
VIGLRTDGDAAVGLGHVRRCLALAAELAAFAEVRFFLRGSEDVAGFVRREGIRCDVVPSDFEATLSAAVTARARGLVIDSYRMAARDYRRARSRFGFLAVIDDTGDYPLAADVVVNPAPASKLPVVANGARYLLGPRFALLGREFAVPLDRGVKGVTKRLLLTLGGAAPVPLVARLTDVARRSLPDASLDVVVGLAGDARLVARAVSAITSVTLHVAPESLRPLMLEADLALTGGGVTLLECAATGTPTLAVELAPNQRANIVGMVELGAVVAVGRLGQPDLDVRVARALETLAADPDQRRALSRRGREIVDGRGAARVAEAIRAGLRDRRPAAEASACSGS